jgi:hypothetical protein
MALHRRRTLRLAGGAAAAALAGCTSRLPIAGEPRPAPEHQLVVEPVDGSPVETALYEPEPDDMFGAEAAAALDAILPEGRYTTYGYRALPADAYVTHDGTYYRTDNVVTGRERIERSLVRAEEVPAEEVPDDAVFLDSLDDPSQRIVEMLHVDAVTDGEAAPEPLRGGAYVLRRHAERKSPLGTGELDGRVVRVEDGDQPGYRIRRTRKPILETAYTALAVRVADSRAVFREVVFATRVDVELAPRDLSSDARSVLEETIAAGTHEEREPLSTGYGSLLRALEVADVEEAAGDRRLWYDGDYYRYALFVNDPE